MSGQDLVVISLEPWDDVWRRNQFLVDGLLRRRPTLRVLFVEPPRDVLHSVLHGRGFSTGAGMRPAPEYDGRLILFQPTKTMPRLLGGMADLSLRRQISGAVQQAGMRNPLLWVNDPHGAGLVDRTRWPSIYDITDDWLAAERPARELRTLKRNEEVLLAECDEIVVCSPGLAASRGERRPVHLIPNAVDLARFGDAPASPVDLPDFAAVYVGTLHADRLDVDLVVRTADRLRDMGASVVLVGPDALTSGERLALERAQVRILGARPHAMVPAYLCNARVLIVPHLVNEFTDSLDPIKLYEYRAAQRPIVSTPVAGFRDIGSAGTAVVKRESFPVAVAAMMADPQPTVVTAPVPDWSVRVGAMDAVIESARHAMRSRQ